MIILDTNVIFPNDAYDGGARVEAWFSNEHLDHPITWRVRFHTPGSRRRRGAAPTRRVGAAPPCAQTLALRLARRFEALRRVIADPRRAVAALARKLRALGAGAGAFTRSIALLTTQRGGGPVFAQAIIAAHDASFDFTGSDTG
jgi:hypothetical protein